MILSLTTYTIFLYFLVFSIIHREIMVTNFVSKDIKQNQNHHSALKRMRRLGIRFDIKAITGIIIFPYITTFILSFFSLSTYTLAIIYSLSIFFLAFLFTAFTIGNYFYYQTYNTYFDSFIFGFFEDDTKAVMQNMFDDYPIIRSFFLTLGLAILPSIFSFKLLSYFTIEHNYSTNALTLLNFILIFLALRGTIKSKPLSKIHAQVSSLNTINYMVPNGPIALSWAIKDHKKSVKFSAVDKNKGETLSQELFNQPSLLQKTDSNTYLDQHKPHVVFSLMESFGSNLLQFDHPEKNDLLGTLRLHCKNDFFFKNFTSYSNGTASSLLGQCCFSTNENLSQSSESKTILPYTAFKTYKEQGYRTIFITSGNGMWRSLATYFPKQGIDDLYDQNYIMDIFPESKKSLSYWGVADEYSFKLAEKLLKESNKPLFIYILTITNHPPYKAPNGYKIKPVDPTYLENRIGKNDEERKNILSAYQYAANALGNFVSNIKDCSLKDKTIIGASGDHHLRGMTQKLPTELFLAYSVPFYLYIPKEILNHSSFKFDINRFASHKDIMPTLYAYSLSNAEFWNIGGRNLLALQDNENYNFSYNTCVWANENGVVDLTQTPYIHYSWKDKSQLLIGKQIPLDKKLELRINSYQQLLDWSMNYLLKGYK